MIEVYMSDLDTNKHMYVCAYVFDVPWGLGDMRNSEK